MNCCFNTHWRKIQLLYTYTMTKQFPTLTNHSFHASVTACMEFGVCLLIFKHHLRPSGVLLNVFFSCPPRPQLSSWPIFHRQKNVIRLLLLVTGVRLISAACDPLSWFCRCSAHNTKIYPRVPIFPCALRHNVALCMCACNIIVISITSFLLAV